MMFQLTVIACVCLGIGPTANALPTSTEFQWCTALNRLPLASLAQASPGSFPKAAVTKAHTRIDGQWDFSLPLARVWQLYTQTPLKFVWRSPLIRYGFATLPPGQQRLSETRAGWPGLQKGLRFYLEIKGDFTGVVCPMAMGVAITDIQFQHSIQFDYLNFSPAYGRQEIVFESLGPSKTRVTHRTVYLGKDPLIDATYLLFHRDAIQRLHSEIKRLSEAR